MNGSGITFIQKEQEVLINSSSQNQVLENNISKSIPLVELNSDHSSCSECPLENKVIDGNSYKLQKCDQPSMSNISENESNEIDLGTKDFLSGKGSLESLIEMMTDQATCINGSKLFTDGVPEEYGKSKEVSNKCQVCCSITAKYRCPRCEIRTCSVPCVKQHKANSGCSGERDKMAFIDISQYGDKDLLNDYRFLEDAERRLFSNSSAPSSHRRQGARFTPYHLGKRCKFLMNAAFKRGISLSFVHPALSKNKANTSFYTISTDTIEWHVDWLFSSSKTLVKDGKIAETTILVDAVRKFTNFTEYPHFRKSLEEYRGERLDASQFLLKLEGLPANRTRYFPLKLNKTLAENLKGLCLIEYPTIVVVPASDQHAQENYPHLCKEDMVEMDRSSARHMLQFHPQLNPANDVERELLNINSSLYSVSEEKEANQLEI